MANNFTVGIAGGMGPLAGVELHRLIIEATPAQKDQDHLRVVLFTNPQIPDRTRSLQEDNGMSYVASVGESIQVLEKAGVDVIMMACMTAHARFSDIQGLTEIPILNGIMLVQGKLTVEYSGKKVALLATDGSIRSGVYTNNQNINWVLPENHLQQRIMEVIYSVKAGHDIAVSADLLVSTLREVEADVFVLGCTELGLLHDHLIKEKYEVLDPLRVLAAETVKIAKTSNKNCSKENDSQYADRKGSCVITSVD